MVTNSSKHKISIIIELFYCKIMQNKIKRLFNKACDEFDLIHGGDRILVGFSGGKDSLTLLHFLHLVREAYQNQENNFTLIAAHIKFSNLPYSVDLNYLSKFCSDRNIEFHIIEDNIREDFLKSGTCVHCSRFRRAKLMELSRVHNCNKLALGHHLDDVVSTLLMNMTQHGKFTGMAIKLDITVGEMKYPLTIIRPLCYVPEDDVKAFIKESNFVSETCRCPWGDIGYRSKTLEFVKFLSKKDEKVRMNFFASQFNLSDRIMTSDVPQSLVVHKKKDQKQKHKNSMHQSNQINDEISNDEQRKEESKDIEDIGNNLM